MRAAHKAMLGILVVAFGPGLWGCGDSAVETGLPERFDLVTLRGTPVTLEGEQVQVGQKAPAFTAVGQDLSTFDSKSLAGTVWILSSVPSLDTGVCSAQTHRFSEAVDELEGKVNVLTVSMDLPFAQKRWCGAKGVTNITTVSDYRDRAFGRAYGVRMRENGLLARAVFVIDAAGVIRYVEIVPEVSHHPDYDAALAAAKKAAGL